MMRMSWLRWIDALLTLLLLVAVTFFLLRLAPGSPFDQEQVWSPELQARLKEQYHLNDPLWKQFGHWLVSVLHGDLKESLQYPGRQVGTLLAESFPHSALLGLAAFFLAASLGIPLGCWCAWWAGSRFDRFWVFCWISSVSLPSYLLASLLILIFSFQLQWFPPALWNGPRHWVLPTLALALRPWGILGRLTRAALLEALQAPHLRTALGKGVSPAGLLFRHALRTAWMPLLTVLGPLCSSLVTGSFLMETLFQIPGMGRYFVQAVLNRDYPLVMGVTLIYGVILIGTHTLIDLCSHWIDPRLRDELQNERAA
jgi:oligopeptide transport system permease protein